MFKFLRLLMCSFIDFNLGMKHMMTFGPPSSFPGSSFHESIFITDFAGLDLMQTCMNQSKFKREAKQMFHAQAIKD